MTFGQDDAASIKACGWRQGSVLPVPLVAKLPNFANIPSDTAPCELWIVVSHDCDVTNSSLEVEPFVEVIPARSVNGAERDGNKHWGKNPRKFQFAAGFDDDEHHYELSIHEVVKIPRGVLAGFSPDAGRLLKNEVLQAIRRWLAKRYVREAFPDAFNDRIKNSASELRKPFKRDGHLLTGIFILVPDDELADDEPYPISVFATMQDKSHEIPQERTKAQRLLDQVEASFADCEGVIVDLVELRAEKQLSLSDLRLLKRWDFDDLSFRESPQPEIPPTV